MPILQRNFTNENVRLQFVPFHVVNIKISTCCKYVFVRTFFIFVKSHVSLQPRSDTDIDFTMTFTSQEPVAKPAGQAKLII